jgi:hypothetical protein
MPLLVRQPPLLHTSVKNDLNYITQNLFSICESEVHENKEQNKNKRPEREEMLNTLVKSSL